MEACQKNLVRIVLQVSGDKAEAQAQIKALYDVFVKSDCTMVEASEFFLFARPSQSTLEATCCVQS